MRLIHVILGLLLAILGLLIFLLLGGGVEGATGVAHPTFDGMNSGGDGLARLGGMGPLIFLLQCLILVLIYALVVLGIAVRHRTRSFWILLTLGCAISLLVWWGMYSSYMAYLETGTTTRLFGYPLPTTLMLFGVFAGGSLLCGLYIWGFRRFIYTEADEAAYEALRREAETPRRPESAGPGGDH